MAARAFIVEDRPTIRQGLVEALAEMAGIETVGVAAGERDALAWLLDPAHAWDVAVVDLLLEGRGNGMNVLRALQGRPRHRKVVVLTATASSTVRGMCLALGCDGVFDKAMETDALIEWCRELAQQRSREPDARGSPREAPSPWQQPPLH